MSILKFKTGKAARGLLEYQAQGAGHAVPDFTNMSGQNPRELAREFGRLRSMRPGLKKAIAHIIISHDPSQRELTREEWDESLQIALEEHGLSNVPYAAYMHQEPGGHVHMHIAALRIDWDGNAVTDSHSYKKNMLAARRIEATLHLDAPRPATLNDRRPSAGGVHAERGRRRFERLHAAHSAQGQHTLKAPKMIDPKTVFDAIAAAKDRHDLVRVLAERGIEAMFQQAPGSDEPTGWRLRQAGPSGTWVKASAVNRGLSWNHVKSRIGERLEVVDQSSLIAAGRPAKQALEKARAKTRDAIEEAGLARDLTMLIVMLTTAIAYAVEKLFGLRLGVLGRLHLAGNQPCLIEIADDPFAEPVQLAKGQVLLSEKLDQVVLALSDGDAELLPDLDDPDVICARKAAINLDAELRAEVERDERAREIRRQREQEKPQ